MGESPHPSDLMAAIQGHSEPDLWFVVSWGGIHRPPTLLSLQVLALGGSVAPAEVFKLFRGREPSTAALLRHNDLLPAVAA